MWRPTTSPTRTRRGARAVAALAVTAALCAVPAASGTGAATAAPYCGITWGSLAKTSAPLAVGRVTASAPVGTRASTGSSST